MYRGRVESEKSEDQLNDQIEIGHPYNLSNHPLFFAMHECKRVCVEQRCPKITKKKKKREAIVIITKQWLQRSFTKESLQLQC